MAALRLTQLQVSRRNDRPISIGLVLSARYFGERSQTSRWPSQVRALASTSLHAPMDPCRLMTKLGWPSARSTQFAGRRSGRWAFWRNEPKSDDDREALIRFLPEDARGSLAGFALRAFSVPVVIEAQVCLAARERQRSDQSGLACRLGPGHRTDRPQAVLIRQALS
jgi:hypothetical protein